MITIDMLGRFFLWCSIINLACSTVSFIMVTVFGKFVRSIHSKLFGVSEEQVAKTIHSEMTLYKTLIFIFCIIPYIAIQIIK